MIVYNVQFHIFIIISTVLIIVELPMGIIDMFMWNERWIVLKWENTVKLLYRGVYVWEEEERTHILQKNYV